MFDSSWNLGGAAEHVIDSSEKRICQLWFEFLSPHVIEIHSNKSLLLYQDYSVILKYKINLPVHEQNTMTRQH